MARPLVSAALVLACVTFVCGSVILSSPDANSIRGLSFADQAQLEASRDRRATFVFGNETGYVYPPFSAERDVVGALRQFIYEGSPAYELLEQNLDRDTVFQAPTSGTEFPNIMSARLRRALVHLAQLVKVLKITNQDGSQSDARLTVIRAYRVPVAGTTTGTDIRYEGRKARIAIVRAGTIAPLVGESVLKRLASLAWDAGVDFVVAAANWASLDVAVVPDRCGAELDLAFLLDGSKSLTDQGWADQMQFVKDVSSFFTIHPNRTRISMTTFHGPLISHISYNASLPSCPPGTIWEPDGEGCVCPQQSICANQLDSSNAGCGTGYYEAVVGACKDSGKPGFDITKAPGCEVRSFFITTCAACTCKPLGQIFTYADSYSINQLFNQTTDRAAFNRTVLNTVFPSGATHMRVGLEVVDSTIFRLGTGMRPLNKGIPRVLIVVSDGKSNPGYEPMAAAKQLRDKGITIFAVGVGEAYEPELDAMASNPRYKFLLNNADALFSIVDRLSYAQCEIPGVLETGATIDINLNRDEYRYVQAECNGDTRLLTEDVIAELTTSTGSMSMHLSATESNPAPLNSVVGAGGNVNPKAVILDRSVGAGLGSAFVGVYGINDGNVGSLTVYQQVFSIFRNVISVPENSNTSSIVSAAPSMVTIPGHTHAWTYRLDRTISGDGFFTINAATGRLSLARRLDFETRSEFSVKIWAQDSNIACIIGYQLLTIKVADINDNRPVFSKTTYVASLDEDVAQPKRRRSVGQMVVQVQATDADSSLITSISYSLISGNDLGLFSLNNKTGELTQILPVDFETIGGNRITLTVVALDGFGGVSDPATIFITINDVDDPPRFLNVDSVGMHEDMQVPENAPVGIVAALTVGDDKTITPFTCSLLSGDTTIFTTTAASDFKACNIRSIRSISGRGGQSFNITVQLRTTGNGYTTSASVKIVIVDSNDFPPNFDKTTYNVISANTQPVGSSVITPVITDGDGTTTFTCSVAQGTGAEFFGFDDSSKPCHLRVIKAFPTTATSFSLVVTASDGFLTDTARVEIAIFRGCAATFQCPVGYVCAAEIDGTYDCTCLDDTDAGLACNVNYCSLADPADGNPCENGATCTNGKSDYTCSGCPANVEGKNCDNVPNLCANSPCLNEGTCVRTSTISASSSILNSFRCDCVDGFYGSDCSEEDHTEDACASSPCENGGTCVRTTSVPNGPKDTYSCQCLDHSFGKTCVKSREECDPNAECDPDSEAGCKGNCQNGGLCVSDDLGGVCRCTAEFYGATCTEVDVSVDPCTSNPCGNEGTCVRTSSVRNGPKDAIECVCVEGVSGTFCGVSSANCNSGDNTCLNDGVCVANANGGSCQCVSAPGECFFGTRCASFAPQDCSDFSRSDQASTAGATAAVVGGVVAGVLVVCIVLFLFVAHRKRQNKPTPLPLGQERTSHFTNPTFVSPQAGAGAYMGVPQMPDDGLNNPMYGLDTAHGGSMYGSKSHYDTVNNNQTHYNTVGQLGPNRNVQTEGRSIRLASVSRKNPIAGAESNTDGDAFGNPMYGANEDTYYGGKRENANVNPAYGFQANKSAGVYSEADAANRESTYATADAATYGDRKAGIVGNPSYATSPASAGGKVYSERPNGLVGNPTYATAPAVQAKPAGDAGYIGVEMHKTGDLGDYTTASEMRQNLSIREKRNESDAYLTIGNQ